MMHTTNKITGDRAITSAVVFTVGDVCPEDYGGGAVVFIPGEGFVLEYTDGLEIEYPESSSMLEGLDDLPMDLYRMPLDEPFYRAIPHYDPEIWRKLGDFIGMHETEVLKLAKSCTIPDICAMHEIYAAYYGWGELDCYPVQISYQDLSGRWEA